MYTARSYANPQKDSLELLAQAASLPNAGAAANMATLDPPIQMMQEDPNAVRAVLGLLPDELVTMAELDAMSHQHEGG
jgi:hypothetical protein